MSFYSDDLSVALNALRQSEIEQSLEERFSQVYPPFDPKIHYQAVLRDELAKDKPLHATPFLLASKPNDNHALVPIIEVTDEYGQDCDVVMATSPPSPSHEDTTAAHEPPTQPDEETSQDDNLPRAAYMHPETRARVASWARHTGAMTMPTVQVAPVSPMVEPRAYAQSVDQLEMATERVVSDSGSDDGKCILPDASVAAGDDAGTSGENGRPALALFKRHREGEEVKQNGSGNGNRRRSARIAALQLQGSPTYRV
ncbi:hypothetical protein ATEIFO6365_0008043600 [Aspergillus terreus]|uniref:Uncharacterized protein n=1 Tax=Aspergillus terreus TaxID=33178 RepID=A0A5M3Z7S9_ASPTE|nr:hypothetical protein ATETN484_0010044500 [Aspergillus terreus]GFF18492.1 hypothetical protein ATEIFO6365_0008043600 [Aspergillus terreus]